MRKQISLLVLTALLSLPLAAQSIRLHSPKLTARTVAAQLSHKKQNANAFLTLKEDADAAMLASHYGVHLNVKVGNRYTAIVPLQMVDSLANDPSVVRIDIGETAQEMLDSVRVLSHIDEIHAGTNGLSGSYKGKGVIVGIIDTGFDYTHPNFKDAAGNSRIQCAWDQTDSSSPNNSYGYGRVYDSPAAVAAAMHDKSFDTHGTHVAGIAVGSAEGNFKGVAPEADIVLVSTNKTEQSIVDGVDFLINYAQAQNKPLAINISFGVELGYKDGSSMLASMIDGLLADKKGILVAIATGNEGHRAATLKTSSTLKSIWKVPAYGRDNMFILGEKDGTYTLKLTLRNTKTGDEFFTQTFSTATEWTKSFRNFGTDDAAGSQLTASSMVNRRTGRHALSLNLLYRCAANEIWEVEMTANNGNMMANSDYGIFTDGDKAGFTAGTNESSIASTATGKEPIAVGAYVSRRYYTDITGKKQDTKWTRNDLYPMSGQGPTFDGRTKPEVVAPGAAVISSFNSFAAPYNLPNNLKTHSKTSNGRNYFWGIAYGTSMATPVVTGTMALWLQAKNDLTAAEVRELLASTSQSDSFTGMVPNNAFGNGKLDALAGLKSIISTAGIGTASIGSSTLQYLYDTKTHTIMTSGAESIQLYSVSGLLLKQADGSSMQLEGLTPGIYVVRINGKTTLSVKIKI